MCYLSPPLGEGRAAALETARVHMRLGDVCLENGGCPRGGGGSGGTPHCRTCVFFAQRTMLAPRRSSRSASGTARRTWRRMTSAQLWTGCQRARVYVCMCACVFHGTRLRAASSLMSTLCSRSRTCTRRTRWRARRARRCASRRRGSALHPTRPPAAVLAHIHGARARARLRGPAPELMWWARARPRETAADGRVGR
jgi:hypothetical protein